MTRQFDAYLNAKTDLAAAPATGDYVPVVDVSDTTEDAGGTLKRVSVEDLLSAGGGLIASSHSTTGAGSSTTSTTFADVDATNVSVTFTVPPSGSVIVRASARIEAGNDTVYSWNLRQGASDVVGTKTYVLYHLNANPDQPRVSVPWKLTGLTPGASITYKLGHARESGAGAASCKQGTQDPVTMEVFSA